MSPGMRTYLKQELARENGIYAGFDFKQVWQIVWDVYRAVFDRAPHETTFSRASITWGILGLGDEVWADEHFARMKGYAADDVDGTRCYELAQKLADTFDQYQMYRPDWILEWDNFTEEDFAAFYQNVEADTKIKRFLLKASRQEESDSRVYEHLKANVWQAKLWMCLGKNMLGRDEKERSILPDDPLAKDYLLDRSAVMQRLNKRLWSGKIDKSKLHERYFIFGVSALPPQVIDFFQALGQVSKVYLMFLNPCREYWGDISDTFKDDFDAFKRQVLSRSPKGEAEFKVKAQLQDEVDPDIYTESAYDDNEETGCKERVEGNQLLLSLGKQGRDNLSLLFNLNPLPDFIDCFIEQNGKSLLHYLKRDLLTLREGGEKTALNPDDRSVRIRVCHTKRREVEVLKDAILECFNEAKKRGEKLLPRDIVVMVPAINEYAPYITSVFGSVSTKIKDLHQDKAAEDEVAIPYAISDRTTLEASPVANAVLSLLDLSTKPITVSKVLDLLLVDSVGLRFNITADDVPIIASWLGENAVYWGLDQEDIQKESQLPLPGCFRTGLDRMILGTMLGDNDEAVSYNGIEGQDAALLGNLNAFIEALIELKHSFPRPLDEDEEGESPSRWLEFMEEKLQARFFCSDPDTLQQFDAIKETVKELIEISKNLIKKPVVKLPVFRSMLLSALKSARDFTPYLRDKVNFCSLIPMRAVPFKHIFIMGLNDDDFPRKEHMPGFNLMAVRGLSRRGDRSRGFEDRFLFLEALLSAQESIYFSYIGESPNSRQELMPSCVLLELMDYISDNFKVTGGSSDREDLEALIIRKEHLSAYHEENYLKKPGKVPSFDVRNFIKLSEAGSKDPSYLGENDNWGLKLPESNHLEVKLEDVTSFLNRPSYFFLKKILGIDLPSAHDTSFEDSEPFALGALSESFYIKELIKLDDKEALKFLDRQEAFGRLPYAVFGKNAKTTLLEARQTILQEFKRHSGLDNLSDITRQERQETAFLIKGLKEDPDESFCVVLSSSARSHPYLVSVIGKPEVRPKFAFELFAEQAARYLAGMASEDVHLIARDGTIFTLEALSKEDMEEHINFVLNCYLKGLLRPYPSTEMLLRYFNGEDYDHKLEPFTYDAEARYLYGRYEIILSNENLKESFLQMYDFYSFLAGKITVSD